MAPASFTSLNENISNNLERLPRDEQDLQDIKTRLEALIKYCSGESGKTWMANLAAKSDNAYFKEQTQVMEERKQVLAGLMQGKTQATETPPDRPGQISLAQLLDLWAKDKKSGCGGRIWFAGQRAPGRITFPWSCYSCRESGLPNPPGDSRPGLG